VKIVNTLKGYYILAVVSLLQNLAFADDGYGNFGAVRARGNNSSTIWKNV
jgi:hypothetical protein